MKTQALSLNIMLSLFPLTLAATAPHITPRDIVVAIIDTGVDITHPDIKGHLWVNPVETKNNFDDDGNGYADDLHGWNFSSNNGDLSDGHGHGTHVAGIILQKANSPRVKLMILKYYDTTNSGDDNLMSTVKAIRYATQMKVDVINYSGGGDLKNPLEEAAIRDAQKQGIVFVAAAGNDGRNTDRAGFFPAGYGLENIIAVAAMDPSSHTLLHSSNYGQFSVDIAAPGKNVFSTMPGGHYGFMTGTSQATAWVTGLVASLLLQNDRQWTPLSVKSTLMKNATKDQSLANKIRSESRISALDTSRLIAH